MAELFAKDTIGKSDTGVIGKSVEWYIRRNWHYFPDLELTIGISPKCGTLSFRELFKDHRQYSAMETKGRCVFVVRNPVDRFISLWKSKARDRQTPRLGLNGMSVDELLAFIESDTHRDHHWLPQSVIQDGRSNELVPFDNWPQWLKDNDLGELPVKNRTEGDIMLTKEQRERVLNYYSKDVELYCKAVKSYV